MGYLRELYGIQGRKFVDGFCACADLLAIWKDGTQVLGVMEKPLKDFLIEVHKE